MSTDQVKLGHLYAEIVSSHDVSRFDEILALGYVNHNPFAEPGPDGVKKVFGAIIAGVPDLKVFAEDVFGSADGTRVVGRYRYVGTHAGNFLGYPATGNAFAMRSIDIWRVDDGRFVEHWDELNTLDIFIQVGAVPPLASRHNAAGPGSPQDVEQHPSALCHGATRAAALGRLRPRSPLNSNSSDGWLSVVRGGARRFRPFPSRP